MNLWNPTVITDCVQSNLYPFIFILLWPKSEHMEHIPRCVPIPKQSILCPCSLRLRMVSSLMSFEATIICLANHGMLYLQHHTFSSKCTTWTLLPTKKMLKWILWYVDCASLYDLLWTEPTWCTNFLNLFIALLYIFRATMCPSSGENTVPMWQRVFVTRQSSIYSDKYQVSHRYGIFSWWWAHCCLKHVQKSNKHIKKICAPSWFYLQKMLKWVYM